MDKRVLLGALALVVSAGTAAAHHGWGSYDAAKPFTISAPVETLVWADPHTHITVKYQGDTWEATLAPLFRMQARGLSEEMLKPGTEVAVEGYIEALRTNMAVLGRRPYQTIADEIVELGDKLKNSRLSGKKAIALSRKQVGQEV